MPPVVIGSDLFGDMFGTREMRSIFSDEALVGRYIEVEVALAQVQANLDIIPKEAAEAIAAAAAVNKVDWQALSARTQTVGYPILPLVEQLSTWPEGDYGQYCHWGATTQDIMDTADVLQIKAALDLIESDLNAVAFSLADLASKHVWTPIAGRTHLQHALPVTFGYKCAGWLSAVDRHLLRLAELRPRVLVGQFSGAAGTLASLGDRGLEVRRELAAALDLGQPSFTWHTMRDGFTETTGFLGLVSGTIGKIGYDIMLMMQTEVGEVSEPFVKGRGASSTMPQKRNPIGSEMMLAAAKIVREQHAAMLDAMVQDHERATGPWQVEWLALPTAFIATSAGLRAARETLAGLEVHESAMRQNLYRSGGLIVAEAAMMGLAPHLGRQVAHDVVYDGCRKALETGAPFADVLQAIPEVSSVLDRDRIEDLTRPENYLGSAPEMVEAYLASR